MFLPVNCFPCAGRGIEATSNIHFYNESMTQEEHKYAEELEERREQSTQTETVFGLRDLPTVTEIVNNKIQEKKKQEEPDLSGLLLAAVPDTVHGNIYVMLNCSYS